MRIKHCWAFERIHTSVKKISHRYREHLCTRVALGNPKYEDHEVRIVCFFSNTSNQNYQIPNAAHCNGSHKALPPAFSSNHAVSWPAWRYITSGTLHFNFTLLARETMINTPSIQQSLKQTEALISSLSHSALTSIIARLSMVPSFEDYLKSELKEDLNRSNLGIPVLIYHRTNQTDCSSQLKKFRIPKQQSYSIKAVLQIPTPPPPLLTHTFDCGLLLSHIRYTNTTGDT